MSPFAVMPKRIQLSRRKGWRMPAGAVKVDRSTRWGNPCAVGKPVDRARTKRWGFADVATQRVTLHPHDAVACFRSLLISDELACELVRRELAGKDLACWCPIGAPCHGDVLLEVANGCRVAPR
jgi:hypothetical protein